MDDTKSKVSSNPIPVEYIPSTGLLHCEETDELILCKPKLMPLKSVTLEKLEKMQNDAEKKLKEQQELEVWKDSVEQNRKVSNISSRL